MFIKDILSSKKEEINNIKLPSYKRKKPLLDIITSLKTKPFITEIKKASPSKGVINMHTDPKEQAELYAEAGAGAISVLTDKTYFKGSFDILKTVAETVDIPVLCKDFVISEIQITKAFASGADVILLIASILDNASLKKLSEKAYSLGMQVLFEIHDIGELDKLENIDVALLGVNARDLKTFEVNRQKAAATIKYITENFNCECLKVAESGIEKAADIKMYKQAGANAYLVGTYLMQTKDVKNAMKSLYKGLNK